jgi:hypothetical protein
VAAEVVVAGADSVPEEAGIAAVAAAGEGTATIWAPGAGKNLAGDAYRQRAAPRIDGNRGAALVTYACVSVYSSTIQPSRSWMIRLP